MHEVPTRKQECDTVLPICIIWPCDYVHRYMDYSTFNLHDWEQWWM